MQLLNELVECGLPLLSSLTFAYINPTYGEWDRTAGTFLYVVFFPHIIHLPVLLKEAPTHLFIFKIFRDAHNTYNPDRDTTMQRKLYLSLLSLQQTKLKRSSSFKMQNNPLTLYAFIQTSTRQILSTAAEFII